MKTVKMYDHVGNFAENKDVAKKLRLGVLVPTLRENQAIMLDFEGVEGATQSFIHALVSDLMRKMPDIFYDNVFYKNANDATQAIIEVVYRYMQEA